MQFVTSIELLHVSALGCHAQGATEYSFYPPTHRNIPNNGIFKYIVEVSFDYVTPGDSIGKKNSHTRI
jgi:hypothetical protein